MSKKRKKDEDKILLSEEPWKVFNILKQIKDNRGELISEDKNNRHRRWYPIFNYGYYRKW